jgi:flagellar biosynthesis/type III secretory pathway M-ring protein FliF/YscJ
LSAQDDPEALAKLTGRNEGNKVSQKKRRQEQPEVDRQQQRRYAKDYQARIRALAAQGDEKALSMIKKWNEESKRSQKK